MLDTVSLIRVVSRPRARELVLDAIADRVAAGLPLTSGLPRSSVSEGSIEGTTGFKDSVVGERDQLAHRRGYDGHVGLAAAA
jgi:hypothetical protein